MSDITYSQYWKEVAELAADCVKEAKERGDELSDIIHESVDGHQWIIYTAYHTDVLKHTECDVSERFAEFGGPDLTRGWEGMTAQAAYLALESDVSDAAYKLRETSDD